MKILLIRPPYVIPLKSVYGNKGVPPLGLAYLSAALKGEAHDVECLDAYAEDMDCFTPVDNADLLANGLTIERILDRVSHQTKVIGISCMFSNEWIHTSRLVRAIKQKFPDIFLVLGGEHATADYEYILQNYPEVNCCILGEGEEKIKNLMNHLRSGKKDAAKIEGVTYFAQTENKIITNDFPYRIKNVNDIRPPDWESVPIRKFLNKGYGFSIQGKRTIPMLLSRGCPYRCTFCSNEKMWTTKWVSRDIGQVIDEIKKNIQLYQIEHIDFYDLTAVVNRTWTVAFCRRLIEENLKVTWALPSGTRSEALDAEVLTLLHQSGCTKITYAPETGSIVLGKKIKKNVNLKNMLSSMRHAVKIGLVVKANIIFGFPEERYRDILMNFAFLTKMAFIGVHDVPCFGFSPYPGSDLFRRLLADGKIKRDENYYRFLASLVYTSPLDRRSWSEKLPHFILPLLSLGGMAFFYGLQYLFRPWRFFIMVNRVYTNKPKTMLEVAFNNIKDDFWHGRRRAT